MTVRSLPISAVTTRADARQVDGKAVAGLVDSIAAVGLINPIRVRPAGDGFEVIAGAHRLAACRELGLADVDCIVVDADDLHAELAMIDENLCRAELSAADRATQTARRKVIYEELHPETVHGGNLEGAGVANLATPETPRFTAATAKVVGISERAVQRDAERGQKVSAEVIALIRGTHLDTGAYLDEIKGMPASQQMIAAKRDLVRRRPKSKPVSPARPPLNDFEVRQKQVDKIMAAWNAASPEAREDFLSQVDVPVMDRRAS